MDAVLDPAVLARAQGGDETAYEQLVTPHRRELQAHCYRMLGSLHDAEDALQETLLAAWKALTGFQQRSSLRTWLYRIATRVCLRLVERRPRRILTPDYCPSRQASDDLGAPVTEPIWLEPWPDDLAGDVADPETTYVEREGVELAYVAALQHLPGTQRAVLILREVLQLPAAEVASMLDSSVASVNSALQRARAAVAERVPERSQQAEREALGSERERALVTSFVAAWEQADIPALLDLLTEDARFTMPPLPAWFDGRDAVAGFMRERLFATPWRLRPLRLNGQLAFACYQGPDFRLGAVNVLSVRDGQIRAINGFVDPALYPALGLPKVFPG
ncbi:sigma-70 family RNA polymerase sigma factor [Luteipulveratus mongoliensis]|uniref:RNA polymerase subunit sigma-24 n=1 Tax=Luteipulveratus mongoliensis TaxID=571913 RepID=A0A0K1JMR3_9MICO|nr:sigma-70 family RNA polymerase sigma factor [Luteipulveratus mongoliensis]AKU18001.1 RNA polymerase subunit sigma-24 [Luteipulveratus mongoliensis]